MDTNHADSAWGSPRGSLAACLMTDAERYTTLSETMEPTEVVEMVNRYFEALFGPVLANGGVVSDVKGDGLLAVWNHESAGADMKASVCKASLEIVDAVARLNRDDPAHCMPTRLGVDFGPVALARVGAYARYEYRPVGDPVNTASRLQELNKRLKTRVLVSASLARGVAGFVFRDLGSFHLRGKRSPVRVLELLGTAEHCTTRELELCREFEQAVAAYDAGAEADAWDRFLTLQARFQGDGPTRHYVERLRSLRQAAEPSRRWFGQRWWVFGNAAGRTAR